MVAEKDGLKRFFDPIPKEHAQDLLEDLLDDKATAESFIQFFTDDVRPAQLAFELQALMDLHYQRRHPSECVADEVESIRTANRSGS